ncbi:MAG: long-chain fatty acid--CoA ligase [Actinomycetota bacterium]|nr:long-chain fatty acid--CoA ligase [Actinomycetota bacterium]
MRGRGPEGWQEFTWNQYGRAVRESALGLIALGVQPGDAVCILSSNRPEWHIADYATLAAAARSAPIYTTNSPQQVAYIAGHAEAKVIFVDTEEQLRKVEKVRPDLPALQHVVFTDEYPESPDGLVLSLPTLRERGRALDAEQPGLYDERWQSAAPEDVATIVYTSGTTGPPKGAMLTHANVVWTSGSLLQVFQEQHGTGRRLSYLPLSHIAERMTSEFAQAYIGCEVWFAESLDTVARDLADCRPTVFFAVPRVWEKFYAGINAKLATLPEEQRGAAEGAIYISKAVVEMRQAGDEVVEEMQHGLHEAEEKMFHPLRVALGLDQCNFFVSGAAPINAEILKFFHAVGIPIAEVYGQTEGTGPTSLNPKDRIVIGTVGPPIPGVEVRIAGDGEILVRGGNVFRGYFKDEAATVEMLEGGWMHTGDVGVLDQDGYLTITDRKKDLIITASGKNVAPQELENALKYHPLISQAVVVGDRRPYLTALITLDQEALSKFAEEKGLAATDQEALAGDPAVEEAIAAAVAAVNAEFSRAEGIKRWRILPRDFMQELDEITPTLKVRRRAIIVKYEEDIESLYA